MHHRFLALCLALAVPAPAQAGGPVFAVVVGVNRPIGNGTQRLLYADDDAILLHRVMATAGYSRLLVEPDRESLAVHGDQPEARMPTRANLEAALSELFGAMKRARARGLRPELFFIYSGHGDVRRGQGFLALADGRLTSADLAALLQRSPALTNHVVIDACRSYYLVHGRDPTRRSRPGRRGSLAHRFPNTGFVLSTASAQNSHEWTELQGGVFSHEVRSGLMGAADIDLDGQVSYGELWAFIQTANARVPGTRFRPRIYVRPPQGVASRALLDWSRFRGATLVVGPGRAGRYVLEDDHGVRLADFHITPSAAVSLRLPQDSRPKARLLLHDLTRLVEYPLEVNAGVEHRLADLTGQPSSHRVKGPAHSAYRHLFEEPFSQERYRRELAADHAPERPPGQGRAAPLVRHGGPAAHLAAFSIGIGAMAQRRELPYAGLASGWFATVQLRGEVYPFASRRRGGLANLVLVGHYSRSINMSTSIEDRGSVDAWLQELCLGLRYRWNILKRPTSPVLGAGLGGGFQILDMEQDQSLAVSPRYSFLELTFLEIGVPLLAARRLGLGLATGLGYRLVSWDGDGSVAGFAFEAGLSGRLDRLTLDLDWLLRSYSYTDEDDASGGIDLYYGVLLSVGLLFG